LSNLFDNLKENFITHMKTISTKHD
jgi:hypothetical protein